MYKLQQRHMKYWMQAIQVRWQGKAIGNTTNQALYFEWSNPSSRKLPITWQFQVLDIQPDLLAHAQMYITMAPIII